MSAKNGADMHALPARSTFGLKQGGLQAAAPEATGSGIKRSHIIALSAAGIIIVAAGTSMMRTPPKQIASQPTTQGDVQNISSAQENTGTNRSLVIVPIPLGGSAAPAAAKAPLAAPPVAPPASPPTSNTVQRGGFGSTAQAKAPDGTSSKVAS
ncbi:MAG: hypothetical protein ACRCWF_02460 [Beijerinckiaceae bacterium]